METVTIEKKFLEKEEKEKLNEIQDQTQSLIFELGEIEMIKISLDDRRKQAESFLEDISIKEKELTDFLSEKYGTINVDPKTGEITKLD
jgi:ribosome-binding ATPase YchF (GTP1/OBG family)